ncbi:hypothetical protein IWW57_005802, partial [Coemansia sp. S610]
MSTANLYFGKGKSAATISLGSDISNSASLKDALSGFIDFVGDMGNLAVSMVIRKGNQSQQIPVEFDGE